MLALSHENAYRVLERSGSLISRLHGRPDLVIGVARSGTAFADVVATASGAAGFAVVGAPRSTSTGRSGSARSAIQTTVPDGVRRAYKSTLYPVTVRMAARQVDGRRLDPEDQAALGSALADRPGGPIVVVDDSIDTGKTVELVMGAIEDVAPGATIILVALNSTIGKVCSPHQLSLVHGAHLHNVDGDPSLLHVDGPPLRSALDAADPWVRPPLARRLYLDLDHTLCRDNTFTMAVRLLAELAAGRELATAALMRKTRATSHERFKRLVDEQIRALPPDEDWRFQSELAFRMRANVRPALLSAATAPSVRAAIVTAALSSYRPAIEQAFGLPVLCGAEPGPAGTWAEPGAVEKATAIEADGSTTPGSDRDLPGLLLGDAMPDLLAAGPVPAAVVPSWDTSGLATVLAASHWWDN